MAIYEVVVTKKEQVLSWITLSCWWRNFWGFPDSACMDDDMPWQRLVIERPGGRGIFPQRGADLAKI